MLPFRVVGPELEHLREGMARLLSFDFDDVAGLRKIDPWAVMSRWRDQIGEGVDPEDLPQAIQIARDLGASYALIGGVVALGDAVRIDADVYEVPSGKWQGKAQVEGSLDSLQSLVDRLSVSVLRGGLLAEVAEVPEPSISRLTTDSLQALLAYLTGEEKYRRSHFREAIPDYTRAIEIDSTFALALYRLSEVYGWLEGYSPRVAELKHRAARYIDQVPHREALLLRGALEFSELRLSSVATFQEFTSLYPDDVEGWYKLGEAAFFLGDAGFYPRELFRNAYRKAVDLDPGFAQLYMQLVDDAFHREDSATARALISSIRDIDPSSHEIVGLELAYSLVWGDEAAMAAAEAALDTASTDVLVSGMRTLIWAGEYREKQLLISLELTEDRHPEHYREFGHLTSANTYQLLGQLDKMWEQRAFLPPRRAGWELISHLGGYTDRARATAAARSLASSDEPATRFWLGAYYASEGRWQEVDDEIGRLETRAEDLYEQADSQQADDWRWYAQALSGYAALQRGDTLAAIELMEGALPEFPFFYSGVHQFLRYELGKLALAEGRLEEAERYLRSLDYERLYFGAFIEFYLGKTYERLDEIDEAIERYDRVVRWWRNCDPQLRPFVEQSRSALVRLRQRRGA